MLRRPAHKPRYLVRGEQNVRGQLHLRKLVFVDRRTSNRCRWSRLVAHFSGPPNEHIPNTRSSSEISGKFVRNKTEAITTVIALSYYGVFDGALQGFIPVGYSASAVVSKANFKLIQVPVSSFNGQRGRPLRLNNNVPFDSPHLLRSSWFYNSPIVVLVFMYELLPLYKLMS